MTEAERMSVPMTNELRLALIGATPGDHWQRLMNKGAADEQIVAGLDLDFGLGGGSGGPGDPGYTYVGGAHPRFWLGRDREEADGAMRWKKPTLAGVILVRAVRMIYGIDHPKGHVPPIVYGQQSLFPETP